MIWISTTMTELGYTTPTALRPCIHHSQYERACGLRWLRQIPQSPLSSQSHYWHPHIQGAYSSYGPISHMRIRPVFYIVESTQLPAMSPASPRAPRALGPFSRSLSTSDAYVMHMLSSANHSALRGTTSRHEFPKRDNHGAHTISVETGKFLAPILLFELLKA